MSEYHVSSLVVHAMADQVESVKASIEELKGTEVPATSETGKLVVVVEGENRKELTNVFEQIRALPSVMSATLIFHQIEDEEDEKDIIVSGVQS